MNNRISNQKYTLEFPSHNNTLFSIKSWPLGSNFSFYLEKGYSPSFNSFIEADLKVNQTKYDFAMKICPTSLLGVRS